MKKAFLKQRDFIVGKANALLYLLERQCKITNFSPNGARRGGSFFAAASWAVCKQGFFVLQTTLVCCVKKPCLLCKEALFARRVSVVLKTKKAAGATCVVASRRFVFVTKCCLLNGWKPMAALRLVRKTPDCFVP